MCLLQCWKHGSIACISIVCLQSNAQCRFLIGVSASAFAYADWMLKHCQEKYSEAVVHKLWLCRESLESYFYTYKILFSSVSYVFDSQILLRFEGCTTKRDKWVSKVFWAQSQTLDCHERVYLLTWLNHRGIWRCIPAQEEVMLRDSD